MTSSILPAPGVLIRLSLWERLIQRIYPPVRLGTPQPKWRKSTLTTRCDIKMPFSDRLKVLVSGHVEVVANIAINAAPDQMEYTAVYIIHAPKWAIRK